jgi:CRISPR-associated protein Cas2
MLVVIAYDIPNDERRERVSRLLANLGERIQRSVFECYLSDNELAGLQARLNLLLNVQEDNLRYYRLCEMCRAKVDVVGPIPVTEERGYYIV